MEGKGSVIQTYRLVCRGRSGQLRWLPSSHGGLEAVVGSNGSMKRFLGVSKKKKKRSNKFEEGSTHYTTRSKVLGHTPFVNICE